MVCEDISEVPTLKKGIKARCLHSPSLCCQSQILGGFPDVSHKGSIIKETQHPSRSLWPNKLPVAVSALPSPHTTQHLLFLFKLALTKFKVACVGHTKTLFLRGRIQWLRCLGITLLPAPVFLQKSYSHLFLCQHCLLRKINTSWGLFKWVKIESCFLRLYAIKAVPVTILWVY